VSVSQLMALLQLFGTTDVVGRDKFRHLKSYKNMFRLVTLVHQENRYDA
jgi:hypothetical protein